MARGNSRAQSEAGTIPRGDTAQSRIARATKLLNEGELVGGPQGGGTVKQADGSFKSVSEETRAILAGERSSGEYYDIKLRPYKDIKAVGKINLMDATIDGKQIGRDNYGAFDKTLTKGRGSPDSRGDFRDMARRADEEQGFIFGVDEKGQAYALPHIWNTNDPQGSVGVFQGDRISFSDGKGGEKSFKVVGTFDSSKRGLNLAAAAIGSVMGREQGIKQTAILLGSDKYVSTALTTQPSSYSTMTKVSYIDDFAAKKMNTGSSDEDRGGYGTFVTKRK
jgi:hypothetical protein